jgi:hypothetical protein
MSISSLFRAVGAPLVNARWSWGSQRASDGAVFLRVWQDLKFMSDGLSYYMVDAHSKDERHSPGYPERQRHVESVRAGASCYLVMCTAKHVESSPREISDFNAEELFIGANVLDTPPDFVFPPRTMPHVLYYAEDGATWILRGSRVPVSSVSK